MTSAIDNSLINQLGLGAKAGSPVSKSLGQSDFLKLLTAQLKEQDPMKPTDSGQFLSDMAQFSTVSGIQDMKNSLDSFSKSMLSNEVISASGLIGKSVMVNGSTVAVSGSSAGGASIDVPQSMSDVKVAVLDANGSTVRTIDMGAKAQGSMPFQWDGKDESGKAVADGRYSIVAMANNGQSQVALNTQVQAKVNSVTLNAAKDGLLLNLDGVGSVDFSAITQIA